MWTSCGLRCGLLSGNGACPSEVSLVAFADCDPLAPHVLVGQQQMAMLARFWLGSV